MFEETKTVYCNKCGYANPSDADFCARCGEKLYKKNDIAHSDNESDYENSFRDNQYDFCSAKTDIIDEIMPLVGENREFYLPRFEKIINEGAIFSWNWSAFFVSEYWMLYRKMYIYFFFVLAVVLITPPISFGLFFLIRILFGFTANRLYYEYLRKIAAKAKTMTEPYKTNYLAQKSGVSMNGVLIFLCVAFILFILNLIF